MKKKIFILFLFLAAACTSQNKKTLDTLKNAIMSYGEKELTIAEEANMLAGKDGTVEYFLPQKQYNNKELISFSFTVTHPEHGICTMVFAIDKAANKVVGFPDKIDINGKTFKYNAFGFPDNTQAWQELLEWELRGSLGQN